jgi:anion-transporting  ArsA/GET3 family ATPase
MLKVADTVLGGPLLEEVAEFLLDLRTAYDGVSRRARQVERHFREAVTIVVTTADPTPMREAVRFFDDAPGPGLRTPTVVFNRVLPGEWQADHDADPTDPLTANLVRWSAEARRHTDVRREFAAQHGIEPVTLPWLPEAPTDPEALAGLLELSSRLRLEELVG